MKNPIITAAAAILIASASMVACDSPKDNVVDAQENVAEANAHLDEATDAYLADVEKYRIATNERIAANDKALADLKADLETDKVKSKAEYREKIAALELKNAEMKRKMEEYKADGRDNWENYKTEFSHDMDGLGDAFRDMTVKNTK